MERKILAITRAGALTKDLKDMAQDIYVSLLEYDAGKVEGLNERGELGAFIGGIITNQYFSDNSPFYKKYKKFRAAGLALYPDYDYEKHTI